MHLNPPHLPFSFSLYMYLCHVTALRLAQHLVAIRPSIVGEKKWTSQIAFINKVLCKIVPNVSGNCVRSFQKEITCELCSGMPMTNEMCRCKLCIVTGSYSTYVGNMHDNECCKHPVRCAFLNGSCAMYPTRNLIMRTQHWDQNSGYVTDHYGGMCIHHA